MEHLCTCLLFYCTCSSQVYTFFQEAEAKEDKIIKCAVQLGTNNIILTFIYVWEATTYILAPYKNEPCTYVCPPLGIIWAQIHQV